MLLEVNRLCKRYYSGFMQNHVVNAVEDVSFSIEEGEIFGLIGESGCGKSTLTKMILGLLKAGSGEIIYDGKKDLTKVSERQWKDLRREIQCVFQHPTDDLSSAEKLILFLCRTVTSVSSFK